MKRWQWFVFCLTFFIVFLIAYTPASLIQYLIPNNAKVQVINPTGSIFNGQANSIIVSGIALDDVSWTISASRLLLGKLQADIEGGDLRNPDEPYIDGIVKVNLFDVNNIEAQDLMAMVPLKQILAQLKLPVIVTTQGRLRITIDEFSKTEVCESLVGQGNWSNAEIRVDRQEITLGDFDAGLSCNEGGYSANVSGDNKFDLDATFTLTSDGKLTRSGTFSIDPSLPEEMHMAAVYFGRENSPGVFTLY